MYLGRMLRLELANWRPTARARRWNMDGVKEGIKSEGQMEASDWLFETVKGTTGRRRQLFMCPLI